MAQPLHWLVWIIGGAIVSIVSFFVVFVRHVQKPFLFYITLVGGVLMVVVGLIKRQSRIAEIYDTIEQRKQQRRMQEEEFDSAAHGHNRHQQQPSQPQQPQAAQGRQGFYQRAANSMEDFHPQEQHHMGAGFQHSQHAQHQATGVKSSKNFCYNCGAHLHPVGRFCPGCGIRL